MNKTLSIGLAGFSFMIEEQAYMKLSDYLTALRGSLDPAEADEVMHDIEIRMVEIFKESLGKRDVINYQDVENMIAQIGTPEAIGEQEVAYYSDTSKAKTSPFSASQKQLFRDPENQKIAGVCAGLAHYVGMEVSWMRIIWVVIAILGIFSAHISTGLEILVYIILWIAVPKAQTAADFLRMKGKPVNFDNIKQESGKIVQFANESTQRMGEIYNANKPYINTAGDNIWNILRFVLGALAALIGLPLLFSSVVIFGAGFDTDMISIPGNFRFILEDGYMRYMGLGFIFLTLFIPAMLLLYAAIKLFSPKTKLNNTGYILSLLAVFWLISGVLFGFKAFQYKTQYSGNIDASENVAISSPSDTIFVDLKKVAIPQTFKAYGNDIFTDRKTVYMEDYPNLDVTRKDGNFAPYLMVHKEADGYNIPMNVRVPVEIVDNKVLLPNYYAYPYSERIRDYDISYELVIPKNKKVIALNDENGFSVNDSDETEDKNANVNIKIGKHSLNIHEAGEDSFTINGKKVSKEEGEHMMDSLNINLDDLKNLNVTVKEGKKKVEITTK